jgi:DNA (cytosine-5)-methyltransferase 1
MKSCAVVDMFCGIGGLTHGFVKEGFQVVAGYDSDASCKYAYEANNECAKFVQKKIESTDAAEISALFPAHKIRVLVGCAPCQPFSLYTVKQPKDEKWKLLKRFQTIIELARPEIVSMENVPELTRHKIFASFVRRLEDLGYHVWHDIVFCPDYGVPQSRRRLVLLASRFGKLELVKKTHPERKWRTVWDAIGKLEAIAAGQRSKKDRIHQARSLNETNLQRIRKTTTGGSWKDWPENLQLACHKKSTGSTYRSIYGRMEWDQPAPTLTTHCTGIGNGRYGHPEQDRAISLREAALLQTFPRRYRFVPPREKVFNKILSRQIGNAVPVRLGQIIARSIRKHLELVRVHPNRRNGSPHASPAQLRHVLRADQRHSARAGRSVRTSQTRLQVPKARQNSSRQPRPRASKAENRGLY